MNSPILITGSGGLVGTALAATLRSRGHAVRTLDLRDPTSTGHGDVRDPEAVRRRVSGCVGIVHLAAVSRVIWGEHDPVACRSTNIDGTRTVLDAAHEASSRPWVIFASSREVYGQPLRLPAEEDSPLAPMNVYGRTKEAGERMIADARNHGLRAAVVRLSNVYGSLADYPDRVVPAFARAAVAGAALRVEGSGHTFDFTHVDDTIRGITLLAELLGRGESPPPPIQFLTGRPTTLGELAGLAVALTGGHSTIDEAAPRSFDVAQFYGSPARARELLGWSPQVWLRDGLSGLIAAIKGERGGAV